MMRVAGRRAVVAVCFALCCIVSASAQNQGPPAPGIVDGYYDGPLGRFTYWSALEYLPENRISLPYAVCNFDAKAPLYFYWNGPDFGSGWDYPLPFGKCETVAHDATDVAKGSSRIDFTQHDEPKDATAYLPSGTTPPINWFSRLESFFKTSGHDTPTILDVGIRGTAERGGNEIRYVLYWSAGISAVAVGFDLSHMSPQVRDKILTDLKKSGIEAHIETAGDTVAPAERPRLKGKARERGYIVVPTRDHAAGVVSFSYEGKPTAADTDPLLVLDDDRRVIAAASYVSVR